MLEVFYNDIDIKENRLVQFDRTLLEILLKDRTTGKNIIWATDNYAHYGEKYAKTSPNPIKDS